MAGDGASHRHDTGFVEAQAQFGTAAFPTSSRNIRYSRWEKGCMVLVALLSCNLVLPRVHGQDVTMKCYQGESYSRYCAHLKH